MLVIVLKQIFDFESLIKKNLKLCSHTLQQHLYHIREKVIVRYTSHRLLGKGSAGILWPGAPQHWNA